MFGEKKPVPEKKYVPKPPPGPQLIFFSMGHCAIENFNSVTVFNIKKTKKLPFISFVYIKDYFYKKIDCLLYFVPDMSL
jgi:hypothetical protein